MASMPYLFLFIAAALAVVQFIHNRARKQRLPDGAKPLPGPKGRLYSPYEPLETRECWMTEYTNAVLQVSPWLDVSTTSLRTQHG